MTDRLAVDLGEERKRGAEGFALAQPVDHQMLAMIAPWDGGIGPSDDVGDYVSVIVTLAPDQHGRTTFVANKTLPVGRAIPWQSDWDGPVLIGTRAASSR